MRSSGRFGNRWARHKQIRTSVMSHVICRAARDRRGDRRGAADQRAQGGPGEEAVRGGRPGAREPAGSPCEIPSQGGRRIRGAPGRPQLQRSARGAREVVAAPPGGPCGGARLHRQRVARYGAAGAKKEERTPGPSNRSCPSWSVRRDPVPAPHGPGTGSPRTSCSRVRPRKRRAATPPSPEQSWPADQPPWRPAPRCPTLPPDIPGPLSPEHER